MGQHERVRAAETIQERTQQRALPIARPADHAGAPRGAAFVRRQRKAAEIFYNVRAPEEAAALLGGEFLQGAPFVFLPRGRGLLNEVPGLLIQGRPQIAEDQFAEGFQASNALALAVPFHVVVPGSFGELILDSPLQRLQPLPCVGIQFAINLHLMRRHLVEWQRVTKVNETPLPLIALSE
jgi:hypothetical protein